MEPTATKQYVVKQLPTDPSEVTTNIQGATLTFSVYGSRPIFIHYKKVGKLYFDIWAEINNTGGAWTVVPTLIQWWVYDDSTSIGLIAAALGVTVNTSYSVEVDTGADLRFNSPLPDWNINPHTVGTGTALFNACVSFLAN